MRCMESRKTMFCRSEYQVYCTKEPEFSGDIAIRVLVKHDLFSGSLNDAHAKIRACSTAVSYLCGHQGGVVVGAPRSHSTFLQDSLETYVAPETLRVAHGPPQHPTSKTVKKLA